MLSHYRTLSAAQLRSHKRILQQVLNSKGACKETHDAARDILRRVQMYLNWAEQRELDALVLERQRRRAAHRVQQLIGLALLMRSLDSF